jgi:hypothetical protein
VLDFFLAVFNKGSWYTRQEMDTDSEERGKYNEKLHSRAAKQGR